MITLPELLKDPAYKEFFCSTPDLPEHLTRPGNKPWRLIVRKKGEQHWRTKRFSTYAEAFAAMKKLLPKIADGTINSPGYAFTPPHKVVKIKGKYLVDKKGNKQQKTKLVIWEAKVPADEFEPHYWCPYCRRATVFRRMRSHQLLSAGRMGGVGIDPELLRCLICGASESLVNLHKPTIMTTTVR